MGKKINRAGVIPYIVQDDKIQMLFMKPSNPQYGGESFQIAKGKQESGESDQETAFREAGEELGLFAGNIDEKYNLGNFLGRTQIFLARIKDKDMFGDPCDETGGVKWMTPEQFDQDGRTLHKPVVKAAVRMIRDKEGIDDTPTEQVKEQEWKEYFKPHLFEMSNFNSTTTGLPDGVKLWVRTEPVGLPHTKFRFKISHPQNGDAVFGFWGDDIQQVAGDWTVSGKTLQQLQTFAHKNRSALMSHIIGDIDSAELSAAMQHNK